MSPPLVSQYVQSFCDYDDATVECAKQQHALILPVAKCDNPLDADDTKHDNRGKRDRKIMLMER